MKQKNCLAIVIPLVAVDLMACDINVFFLHVSLVHRQNSLERIHDVAIAAIESQVIPGPVCDGANLVATAEKVEQVQE